MAFGGGRPGLDRVWRGPRELVAFWSFGRASQRRSGWSAAGVGALARTISADFRWEDRRLALGEESQGAIYKATNEPTAKLLSCLSRQTLHRKDGCSERYDENTPLRSSLRVVKPWRLLQRLPSVAQPLHLGPHPLRTHDPFMRSDHWNFLANLLGTPSPAGPPKKKKEEEKPESAAPKVEAEKVQVSEPVTKSEPTAEREEETREGGLELPSGEEILDALAAAVPPQILPGFGPSKEDEEREAALSALQEPKRSRPSSRSESEDQREEPQPAEAAATADADGDDDESDEAFESAWGGLAAELGVEPVTPPAPKYVPSKATSESPERDRSRTPRAKSKRSESGFGKGLGIGGEPESDDDDEQIEEASLDSAGSERDRSDNDRPRSRSHRSERGRDDRSGGGGRTEASSEARPDSRSGRSDSRQRVSARGDGRRRPEGRDDRQADDVSSFKSESSDDRDDWDRDEPKDVTRSEDASDEDASTRRRRRGRRGTRQRMSEGDLPRAEADREESTEESAPARGRRGERSERGRDRDRDAARGGARSRLARQC